MSLTIAQVSVLRYNYHDLQWGEAKTCWVRVVEESGEYVLKIDPEDGGVSYINFDMIAGVRPSDFYTLYVYRNSLNTSFPKKILRFTFIRVYPSFKCCLLNPRRNFLGSSSVVMLMGKNSTFK
jgi:hypothetical protein